MVGEKYAEFMDFVVGRQRRRPLCVTGHDPPTPPREKGIASGIIS